MTIEKARELLEQKKKQENDDEKEKVSMLYTLFKDDNIFFQLNMRTAFGILEFLGVEEDKIQQEYMELVSPIEYHKHRVFVMKEEEK